MLRHLDLSGSQVTLTSLYYIIQTHTNIEKLALHHLLPPHSPIQIPLKPKISKLLYLDLSMSSCSNQTSLVTLFSQIPLLKHINLSHTHIHDSTILALLENCPDLICINVEQCKYLTDLSILALTSYPLTKLKSLDVSGCHTLSVERIHTFCLKSGITRVALTGCSLIINSYLAEYRCRKSRQGCVLKEFGLGMLKARRCLGESRGCQTNEQQVSMVKKVSTNNYMLPSRIPSIKGVSRIPSLIRKSSPIRSTTPPNR